MARNKTLAAQLNALHSERLAAVAVFTRSAEILEETAEAYQALADQAADEARERQLAAEDALSNAVSAFDQARKIRELAG